MSIKAQLQSDLMQAMRAKEKQKLAALRLLTAAIKQVEVDERIEVDDARLLVILDKLAKQRRESIAQFEAAKRDDLVAQETFELELISHYLPKPLSEKEIADLVEASIATLGAKSMADMGKVMAELKPKLQGRCDMSKVSALIKTKLQSA